MTQVTTREVQHHFARVLAKVEAGETVVVTKRGEDVAVISAAKLNNQRKLKVPDFSALRRELGTEGDHLENEVIKMRDESR